MKKYIRADLGYLDLSDDDINTLIDLYIQSFADRGFSMELDTEARAYNKFVLKVVAVDGDSSVVYEGKPYANGYVISSFEFHSPNLDSLYEEDFSKAAIRKKVDEYIHNWNIDYNKLVKLSTELQEIEPLLPQIAADFKADHAQDFPDLKITAKPYTLKIQPGSKYPILYGTTNDAEIQFEGVAAGKEFDEVYDWYQWESGEAEADLSKKLARIYKSVNRGTKSKSDEIIAILKEYNIDTTKSKYKLVARTYERYESGRAYTKTFTCPGDYLAYFSMAVHRAPNYNTIVDYFGDITNFEGFVERFPTLNDMASLASSNWWGDGDDFIISLTNLSTGEVLYENEEDYTSGLYLGE